MRSAGRAGPRRTRRSLRIRRPRGSRSRRASRPARTRARHLPRRGSGPGCSPRGRARRSRAWNRRYDSAVAEITLVRGDITLQEVDAIVNAANGSLMGGGGVDGAIHREGGQQILDACRRIRAERFPDGLPTGRAVATTAGRLPATWVIHTVGPVFSKSEDRSVL